MSIRDELQRPHVRALLIGGGIILLLAIALYFATKKKTDPLAAGTANGLNADASGPVPTVIVLPPPVFQLEQPPSTSPVPLPPAPSPVPKPGGGVIPPIPSLAPPPTVMPGTGVHPPVVYP
jgi:hypothetical protein